MIQKEAKKITRPRIDDEVFVKAWMKVHAAGGTQSDVAAELNCTAGGVSGKHKRLAEGGVKLPELQRKKKKVDAAGLNSLIKSLEASQ